ncbi:hypothetical protein ACFV5G_34250, partial [Streptomyces sp. NPDC059766]|uniref:hypothetical protein n=1 Tax=Streptomyces sp. NPDC059766 TaxID=3346940 RepID=UPI00364901F6
MSPTPVRFHDPGVTDGHFRLSALVRCPRCERVAHFEWRTGAAADGQGRGRSQQRVVCRSCGLSRISGPGGGWIRPPLWLETTTRHGTIWAYNLEHLDLLRRFVAASLRERAPWYEHGRKMTYVARLPAWIKSAKNRDEVLRAIAPRRATGGRAGPAPPGRAPPTGGGCRWGGGWRG